MIRNTTRGAKQTHGERPTSKTLRRGDSIIIFANMDRETWTKWEDWLEEVRRTTNLPGKLPGKLPQAAVLTAESQTSRKPVRRA